MLSITYDPSKVERNVRRQISDFKRSNGVMGMHLREGMQKVYSRVNDKLKKAFGDRYFYDYRSKSKQVAPKVVRGKMKEALRLEHKGHFNIVSSDGFFTMGLGNVDNLDRVTQEVMISAAKARAGETPEQTRVSPAKAGRETFSIWRIIEFGTKKGYPITPKAAPVLIWFSHKHPEGSSRIRKDGSLSDGRGYVVSKQTTHSGVSAKRIFLKAAHELYQSDINALKVAARNGLHAVNVKYHGKAVRRR